MPDGPSSWRLDASNDRPALISFCVQGPGTIEFSWSKSNSYGSAFNLSFFIENSNSGAQVYNINSPKTSAYITDNKRHNLTWEFKKKDTLSACYNCYSSAWINNIDFKGLNISDSCGNGSCPIIISSNMNIQEVQEKLSSPCNTVVLEGVVDEGILQYIADNADNRNIQLDSVRYNASIIIHRDGITFESRKGETAILDGSNRDQVIRLNEVDNVIIKNILIRNGKHGVVFDGTENCKASNLDIRSFSNSGICLWNAINNTIENNRIKSTYEYTTGLWMDSCNRNTMSNNTIELNSTKISFGELFTGSNRNIVNGDKVFASNETFILQNISSGNSINFICAGESYIFDNNRSYHVNRCAFPNGRTNLTTAFENSWRID